MSEPFSVGQGVAFATGIASLVLGAIGLIRAGTADLTGPTTEVAGLRMTGALALAHVVMGLLALLGAGLRSAAVGSLVFVGPAFIVAGIIALAENVEWLGWTDTNGIVYLLAGVLALGGAMLTPDKAVVERRSTTFDQRS
ncbi:MAG TPA: hypothetical protein VGB83_01855 [Actinomycetota bacterium]